MACVADRLVAAPFSFVGSIGVVAALPNFHRVLSRAEVGRSCGRAVAHTTTPEMASSSVRSTSSVRPSVRRHRHALPRACARTARAATHVHIRGREHEDGGASRRACRRGAGLPPNAPVCVCVCERMACPCV